MAGGIASQDKSAAYDTRFDHKLTMPERRTGMLKWTGILLLAGAPLLLLGLKTTAYCMRWLSSALFAVWIILPAAESYQGKGHNEIAAEDTMEPEGLEEH